MIDYLIAQVYAKRARASQGSPRYQGLRDQADFYIRKLESEDEKEALILLMDGNLQEQQEDFSIHDSYKLKSTQPDGKRKAKLRQDFLNLIEKQLDLVKLYNTLYDLEMMDDPDLQAIVDQYAQIEDFCANYTAEMREQLESTDPAFTGDVQRYVLILQLIAVAWALICEHSVESAVSYLKGFKFVPIFITKENMYCVSKWLIQSPVNEPMSTHDIIDMILTVGLTRSNAPALIEFLTRYITQYSTQFRKEFPDIFKYLHAHGTGKRSESLDAVLGLKLHSHPEFTSLTEKLVLNLLETDPVYFYARYASAHCAKHQPEDFRKMAAEDFWQYLTKSSVNVAQDLLKWVIASPAIDNLPYDIYPTIDLLEDFYLSACKKTSTKEARSAVIGFVYKAINHTKLVDQTFSFDSSFVIEIRDEYHRLHGSDYSLLNISSSSSEFNLETVNQKSPSSEDLPGEPPRARLPSIKQSVKL